MVQLVIELPDDLYERLRLEAERQGKTPEQLAVDILTEYLATLDDLDEGEVALPQQP
jgi:plasmid stability protein